MNPDKEILLNEALDRVCNIGWGLEPDELLENYFSEKAMIIGTTADEQFFNLDGMRTLIRRQKEQSAGMDISFTRVPVFRNVSGDENVAVIVENVTVAIQVNNDTVSLDIRSSAIMEYKEGEWKLIHWHASKPEMVQSDTDTFGIEDWKQKTDALEKLVAERTADLVIKNRELEIETALEKVRSRTMAMRHSAELADASFVLDSQVRALGIETWGCAFNIYGPNESTEWFSSARGTLPAYRTPRENLFLRYYEAGQAGASIHVESFSGEACAAHYEYLCTIPVMGDALRAMIAAGGSFPVQQTDHVVYFRYGYLLFITLLPVPEAYEIFIRFAKVFEQTYTRFLDLQKAEAQALRAEQDVIAIKQARQKAEEALSELQAAQKQLIQAEKMASLGELTAGIAHEIQNPLNFVNNFSELSKDLLGEMKTAMSSGDQEEVMAIYTDLIQNLEKIHHHGKRADSIVKGMLQHSRAGNGQKEPVDINALCEEYLHLSYHGLRAKDKSFNAAIETNFDGSIGTINIIPQDIGRVIMNILNNAFYAVQEKEKKASAPFRPTVTVTTKKINDNVEIVINDNGNGVPDTVKEKIFQPFFTTKPTGQGTGLGLSLSYDIVKAMGGGIMVETEPGNGSTFTVSLPV